MKNVDSEIKTIGDICNSAKNNVEQTFTDVVPSLQEVSKTVTDEYKNNPNFLNNAADTVQAVVAGTLESARKDVTSLWKSGSNYFSWSVTHPIENQLLTSFVAKPVVGAIVALEMTPGVNAWFNESMTTLSESAAMYQTANSIDNVADHGELSTLLNQRNHSQEEINKAKKQLKSDTGNTMVTLACMGLAGNAESLVKNVSVLSEKMPLMVEKMEKVLKTGTFNTTSKIWSYICPWNGTISTVTQTPMTIAQNVATKKQPDEDNISHGENEH